MAVGARDFPVQRFPVAILGGHQGAQASALRQRNLIGIAHGHQSVSGQTDRAGFVMARDLLMALLHRRPQRGNGRRVDLEVALGLQLAGAAGQQRPGHDESKG